MAAGGDTTLSTIRVGRKAPVWPVPPVRTSTNNGKKDDIITGGRRPAMDDGTGEHTVLELHGAGANEDNCCVAMDALSAMKDAGDC